MFCDGVCEKKNKRCGLLLDVVMSNERNETKIIKQCALIGLFESMVRQEQGQIRIQAAVESGRNEQARSMRRQNATLATGFLGLIHMVNENEEHAKKIKYLNDVTEQIEYIESKEEIQDAEIVEEGELEDVSVHDR